MSKKLPIFYSALLLTLVNLLLRFVGTGFQVYLSRRIGTLRPDNAAAPPSGTYAAGLPFPLDGGEGTARETHRRLAAAGLLEEGEGSVTILNSSGREELLALSEELLRK